MGKVLTNFDHFANKLDGGETDPNYKEALMMLNEDIFNVSETPRIDQTNYIKQVWKPNNTSYHQVVLDIDTMLDYLQYFASNLDTDGNCAHKQDQLVLSEYDYQKVLFELAPTAWYNHLISNRKKHCTYGTF
eukprot:3176093-Ditylum_brightwellii.AAC.1